jgi:hypothetical protein
LADIDLQTWRHSASAGEKITYHTGFIMKDRHTDPVVDAIALAAWNLYTAGRVCLLQQKITDGLYDYLAVATAKQPAKSK